jgi:hypothetical protein
MRGAAHRQQRQNVTSAQRGSLPVRSYPHGVQGRLIDALDLQQVVDLPDESEAHGGLNLLRAVLIDARDRPQLGDRCGSQVHPTSTHQLFGPLLLFLRPLLLFLILPLEFLRLGQYWSW